MDAPPLSDYARATCCTSNAGRKQIGAGILIAVAATLLLFGVVTRSSQPDRWVLAGTGLAGGALAAWCGRLPRLVIVGVVTAITGMLVAFSGVSLETGFTILFGVQGLATLLSGAAAVRALPAAAHRMSAKIQRLAEVDRIIHEPARLMVVALFAAVKEADFQYLHNATGLTKGNLSVHLSKLEEAGYIGIEKSFRGKYPLTICRLTERGRTVLEGYRRIIKGAL